MKLLLAFAGAVIVGYVVFNEWFDNLGDLDRVGEWLNDAQRSHPEWDTNPAAWTPGLYGDPRRWNA